MMGMGPRGERELVRLTGVGTRKRFSTDSTNWQDGNWKKKKRSTKELRDGFQSQQTESPDFG